MTGPDTPSSTGSVEPARPAEPPAEISTNGSRPVPRPATPSEIHRAEARPRFAGLARIPGLPALAELAEAVVDIRPTGVAKALPDVARVTGAMLWRTNQWTINASLHIGDIVIRGAVSGRSAQSLVEQVSNETKQSLRELLGIAETPDPMPKSLRERLHPSDPSGPTPTISLPDRMNALLDASSDLSYPDSGHPAYVRLLSELAPDEARILRLFAERGPQPSVDVRTRRPFGVGSELVAPGITMIGRYAGCRNVERVPAYLNNLFRLGLVWFSREALPEQSLYDVLEAQEEVEEAMRRAGRGVTVRRSIELTAFGRNLCAMTGLLPPSDSAAALSDNETTKSIPPPDAAT